MNLLTFALLLAVIVISSLLLLYTFKANKKVDGNHKKTNWQHGAKCDVGPIEQPSYARADAKPLKS